LTDFNAEEAAGLPLSAAGQFPPPSLATGREELASTPDAKARNRYASF